LFSLQFCGFEEGNRVQAAFFWGAAAVKWVWRRNAMKTFE
jgi:hypothetical protein